MALFEKKDLPEAIAGDDIPFTVSIAHADGLEVGDWKVSFTLKHRSSDADDDAIFTNDQTVTVGAAETSFTYSFEIPKAMTEGLSGKKYYDIVYLTPAGKERTPVKGQWDFKSQVTKRVPGTEIDA